MEQFKKGTMDEHQKRVKLFMELRGQKTPSTFNPMTKEECLHRAKMLWEETKEQIHGLACKINYNLEIEIDDGKEPDWVEIIDGIADCSVINNGTAVALGVDMSEILEEVDHNNLLKFMPNGGGYLDENKKWRKGKNHPKPRIKELLIKQGLNS